MNQSTMQYSNRVRGSLLGFAIGDALGATTEFMTAERIKKEIGVHRDITGGGWLELEPGQVTDDTEMMLIVARSLVDCNGFNARNMANGCLDWYNDDPIDIGHTIRAGLHRYAKTAVLERPASHDQAGNGALMRILPFALADGQMMATPTSNAIDHAHLTHNTRESDCAIECYLWMIDQMLQGISLYSIEVSTGEYDGKCGGYVVETINTVLHCLMTTTSFEDALIKCVNLGGDADTNAAILGGLAGAYYGIESIPQRWLDALNQDVCAELINLADALTGERDE